MTKRASTDTSSAKKKNLLHFVVALVVVTYTLYTAVQYLRVIYLWVLKIQRQQVQWLVCSVGQILRIQSEISDLFLTCEIYKHCSGETTKGFSMFSLFTVELSCQDHTVYRGLKNTDAISCITQLCLVFPHNNPYRHTHDPSTQVFSFILADNCSSQDASACLIELHLLRVLSSGISPCRSFFICPVLRDLSFCLQHTTQRR